MARPPNPEASARLLSASRHVFATVGYDAARIQDIAAAADFSKAAFYLYFDSKEAVFDQLCGELFEAFTAVVNDRQVEFQALVDRLGTCGAEDWQTRSARLAAFADLDHTYNLRSLQVLWAHREFVGCLLHQAGSRREMVDWFVDVIQQTLSVRLREAADAGYLRPDIEGDLCAEMVIGVWLQLARRMLRLEQAPDLDAWARAVDQFVSEGLGTCPACKEER